MRKVHHVAVAVAVVVAGVVLGSGISGFAVSPASESCAFGDGSYTLVPFGTRCENPPFDGAGAETVEDGPSVPAWIGWMVAMAALCAWAVRRPRGSRPVAGALAAAVVLAAAGFAAHNGTDFFFTMWAAVVFGTPLAFVTRHLWLPPDDRSRARSFGVTLLLVAAVVVVATPFTFITNGFGHLGAALGIATGAAASVFARSFASSAAVVGEPT